VSAVTEGVRKLGVSDEVVVLLIHFSLPDSRHQRLSLDDLVARGIIESSIVQMALAKVTVSFVRRRDRGN
jgi:hypothetical protein